MKGKKELSMDKKLKEQFVDSLPIICPCLIGCGCFGDNGNEKPFCGREGISSVSDIVALAKLCDDPRFQKLRSEIKESND